MTEIRRLDGSDDSAVSQFLRIYQSSIEPSEQKTAAQVKALVADSRYHVLASLDGAKVTGFAVVFIPSRTQFVLLEYMAVDANLRSHGVGAALLDAASEIAAEQRAPLLLEVDQPVAVASPENDPVRRLRFYAEHGCRRIVGLDYILPLAMSGTPPPMWLLVRGAVHSLSGDQLRQWLTALYVEVYGRDECDPRIDAMMSNSGCHSFVMSPVA